MIFLPSLAPLAVFSDGMVERGVARRQEGVARVSSIGKEMRKKVQWREWLTEQVRKAVIKPRWIELNLLYGAVQLLRSVFLLWLCYLDNLNDIIAYL